MFFSYQVAQTSSILVENGSGAFNQGVGTVNLKFTLGKTVRMCSTFPISIKILSADLFYVNMV
jgi:hypothetical protein